MTSPVFNEGYYEAIWGTVHRHDYCDSLADQLIARYGKGRYLDIGTGCGYLVKVLRDKGCDAWGLEISDYALANCCAQGYVLKGSVTDIPFKDNSFDVVHSQGLWGYFPEDEILKAWSECLRVGARQHHNIDYNDDDPTHQYLFWKPKEWWDERLQVPKVLVCCTVHECKDYCFQQWIDNVKSLTYPNYEILVMEHSPTEHFYNKYKAQIPMERYETDQKPEQWLNHICQGMALIQKKFLAGNYTHWMNIEADNIPPQNIIERLLQEKADWASHCYRVRPDGKTMQQGIGCSLLSRKLMTDFNWTEAADSPDAELWNYVQKEEKHTTAELWYFFNVLHLK